MIANGKIYKHPNGFTCMTQWLSNDMWCLLCGPSRSIRPGGTIFMAQSDGEGKWMFTRSELDQYIQEKGCVEMVGAYLEVMEPEIAVRIADSAEECERKLCAALNANDNWKNPPPNPQPSVKENGK